MKKITFLLMLCVVFSINSQDKIKIGATIGYSHLYASGTVLNTTIKANDGSGYIGLFSEISLSNQLSLTPQIQYLTEFETLFVPIQFEFKTKIINFLLGPQINISTEKMPDDFTAFTISAVGGLSYNLDKNLKFLVNYSYGITDNYTGNLLNFDTKNNSLSFGILFNFVK